MDGLSGGELRELWRASRPDARTMRVEISDADHRRLRVPAAQLGVNVQSPIGRAVVEQPETRGALSVRRAATWMLTNA